MAATDRGVAESLGQLLIHLRETSGRSQLRLAELLCAAAGVPTVTRHEISRWEREHRVPSAYWLDWLAVVLDVPLDELERAAARTRARRTLAAATGRGPHRVGGTGRAAPVAQDPLTARIHALRRADDLVSGPGLGRTAAAELRSTVAAELPRRDQARRAHLARVAELAQLAAWVAADAGEPPASAAAHRLARRAAAGAGDRALLGHILATQAHLHADPAAALRLADAAVATARPVASAATRALLLHRLAFAAARAGQRSRCERALAAAERSLDGRDGDRDPDWLYWLDEIELRAMTGRCLAALGRSAHATPLLRTALRAIRTPRSAAIYGGWLAEAHLAAGEVDRAFEAAGRALVEAVRAGSVRAAARTRATHRLLTPFLHLPAGGAYADLSRGTLHLLPGTPLPRAGGGRGLASCS